MRDLSAYYLVRGSVLPETCLKVLEAKKLLQSGKAKTIKDAVKKVQISRSVFYKYKDNVEVFSEAIKDKIVTLYALLKDEPGVLSALLKTISKTGVNILTINQNIPVNGAADVTISVRTGQMQIGFERLLDKMQTIDGVLKVNILSSEQ